VGCRVRCRFCRSGREGFRRDLAAAEIVAQVAAARAGREVRRVVFMGIGEPLDNYEAVASSIRILSDEKGRAMAPRRLVVSTIGRTAGIGRLAEDFGGRVGLAVSLHSGREDTRARLVGARGVEGPGTIVEAARAYPLPARERVTVEVVLVGGVNDSRAEARALVSALHGLRCRVNLIPLNPWEGLGMEPPRSRDVEGYRRVLEGSGLPCFVRRRRGSRILASCGQLAFGSRRR
jgi:23S rRNA (adenine2503-C2)-methyltransferase